MFGMFQRRVKRLYVCYCIFSMAFAVSITRCDRVSLNMRWIREMRLIPLRRLQSKIASKVRIHVGLFFSAGYVRILRINAIETLTLLGGVFDIL